MTQNTSMPDAVAIYRSLGAIEGKQDLILLRIDQETKHREALSAQVDKLGARVSSVETKLTYWSGALAIIASLAFILKEKILHLVGAGS